MIVLDPVTGEGVQTQGHIECLRGGPEGIVHRLFVAIALGGIRDDDRALETLLGAALEFAHGQLDIPHRDESQPRQGIWCIGTVLGEPVVVDAE